MIRQGDVLLIPTDDPVGGMEVIPRDSQDRIVLAYGEVTGHAHAIRERGATLYSSPRDKQPQLRILKVEGNVCFLRHDEHTEHALNPGSYKVIQQREYTPEEIRTVAD